MLHLPLASRERTLRTWKPVPMLPSGTAKATPLTSVAAVTGTSVPLPMPGSASMKYSTLVTLAKAALADGS